MRSLTSLAFVASLASASLVAPLFSPIAAAAPPRVATPAGREGPRATEGTGLRARFGVPAAVRLLQSDDAAERVRGIERLGALAAMGNDEAVDALVEQLEQGQAVARDPRARLTGVRVLAAHEARTGVRQLLMREATDASSSDGRSAVTPLGGVIRGTAALAIARGGDKKALTALLGAALSGGVLAESSMGALKAHPPPSLEALLEGKRRLTPQLAALLGELGDLRAIGRLRALLEDRDPAGQIAAATALAKLGDHAALPVARVWLGKSDPVLRRAAAEVFVALSAPEAPAAIAVLLAIDSAREDGLRLALTAPAPALAGPLAAALPAFADASRPRVVGAIGRAGGPRAVDELIALLGKPELRVEAAYALARMPGDGARAALERSLTKARGERGGDALRLLLRAGVVRALAGHGEPAGLKEALAPLLKAASSHGELEIEAVVAAVARATLARPPREAGALFPALAREAARRTDGDRAPAPASLVAVALGVALLARPDGADLATSTLAAWAEEGGPLAPLAARALASRDADSIRGLLKRLLEGSDPVVRAHVALGLAWDPEPSATSLLTAAYRFEDDAGVRRAVVRALSVRAEAMASATLTLARDLDPDDGVRALARAASAVALKGPRPLAPGDALAGPETAWITVNATGEGAPAGPAAARLVRGDGLAIPVVADADGALLVPGLAPGLASLWLAD
jgi:cellulose synthase operon protein C